MLSNIDRVKCIKHPLLREAARDNVNSALKRLLKKLQFLNGEFSIPENFSISRRARFHPITRFSRQIQYSASCSIVCRSRKFLLREFSRESRKPALLPAAFLSQSTRVSWYFVQRQPCANSSIAIRLLQLRVISFRVRIEIPRVSKRVVLKSVRGTCAFYLKAGISLPKLREKQHDRTFSTNKVTICIFPVFFSAIF